MWGLHKARYHNLLQHKAYYKIQINYTESIKDKKKQTKVLQEFLEERKLMNPSGEWSIEDGHVTLSSGSWQQNQMTVDT